MGTKLLWTAVAIYLIAQGFGFIEINIISAVLALIGIVLVWLDR